MFPGCLLAKLANMTSGILEEVVLVDGDGKAIGEANKAEVHTANTPRHLAFSCYLFNDEGQLLVSRRALTKLTWPGVWTNSFCGHPAPGESFSAAIGRRAEQELGLKVTDIEVQLPRFSYQATDDSGVVENEFCPVYSARTTQEPNPNPTEVMATAWVDATQLRAAVAATPWAFSPWLVLQLPQLKVGHGRL